MNIKELENQLQNLRYSIDSVLKKSGYKDNLDLSEVDLNNTDPQERFLKKELEYVLAKLNSAVDELEYLSKPIESTGILHKNENGRYSFIDNEGLEYEFSCGTGIEFLATEEDIDENGDIVEVERWVASSVEAKDGKYYIVRWPELDMEGLTVRKRSYWS